MLKRKGNVIGIINFVISRGKEKDKNKIRERHETVIFASVTYLLWHRNSKSPRNWCDFVEEIWGATLPADHSKRLSSDLDLYSKCTPTRICIPREPQA